MAWCTYPSNETLIYQQAFLYQLFHPHPSQQCQKDFHAYMMSHDHIRITMLKCNEQATTVLQTNIGNTSRTDEYKAGEGVPCYL